jgi:hypothetical protein
VSLLERIVEHYQKWYRPKSEAELDCFRRQTTLASAVALASVAEDDRGRRFSHQRRLKTPDLARSQRKLLANVASVEQQKSFARLHERLEKLVGHLSGLGELYLYDTGLRIGAKLGLMPQAVYLHAGTRVGATELGIKFEKNQRALFLSEVPAPLRTLAAHEIEDVLCIYKKVLGAAIAGEPVSLPDDDVCYLDDVEE